MKTTSGVRTLGLVVGMTAVLALIPQGARAHCDTLGGPVVAAAKAALEKSDITPVLKWVKAADEPAIRDAFQKTLVVRAKGPEAKALADMYFFETLVRVHRAGEGAPYTGLKPADAIEPIVAAGDHALESGSVDEVVNHVTGAVAAGIRERFSRAAEAKKHADESVDAGREFVEAYVVFMHYVEGIHQAVLATAHHAEDAPAKHAEGGAEAGHRH